MFAASAGNIENPLTSLVVGERPEPAVPEGWVRVKVSHASLNRHDIPRAPALEKVKLFCVPRHSLLDATRLTSGW